jgi:hypothetical protein
MSRRGRVLRGWLAGTALFVVVASWYVLRFEGAPQPVDPLFVGTFTEAPAWSPPPLLLQREDEPGSVYVVPGKLPVDGQFEAVRVELKSGARSGTRIRFGPGTPFIPFDSAETTGTPALELRGLAIARPTLHLFSFPDGGGPGFHREESATGMVRVSAKAQGRLLLERSVINSSALPEMRALLWSDRSRRLAAFLSRETRGWTLYLFSV